MASANSDTGADTEIIITRVLNARRELVWRAWTDPQHLPNWWGPRGFTTRTHAMELKPGGEWRYVMIGPDGREYENLMQYEEIVEPERLRYRLGGELGTEPVNFRVLVTFERVGTGGAQTRVTMKSTFDTREARDFVVREYHAIEGGEQHLERLEEYARNELERPAATKRDRPFVVTRVLKAQRQRVWDAWTRVERLSRWFGPKGMTVGEAKLDLRVGGVYHYRMRMPDGLAMWGKWTFREIVPLERLVVIQTFSDPQQALTRHPLNPGWPLQMLSTMTLADHAGFGGGTTLVLEWTPFEATEAERQVFAAGHASMQQGWDGTLAQLEEHLQAPG